ncbi:ROK family protein, partial [Clostridioides difficile]|uniref:ROK family protein n=1 Tax=Clostridioides difficile TaxID=1496 RepID=UPI003F8D70A7
MSIMLSNTLQVKQLNKELIRSTLKKHEISTKSSIAKETGLSVATCGTILNEMLIDKEIIEIEQAESRGGRPACQYTYNKNYYHVVGIYANNESSSYEIGFAVANALEEIVEKEKFHPDGITYTVIEDLITKIVNKYSNIKAIGLGLPGVIYDGYVDSCDIESLKKLDIGKMLKKKFNVNIVIENDMNFITYGVYNHLHIEDN